jgi:hypothetical protein
MSDITKGLGALQLADGIHGVLQLADDEFSELGYPIDGPARENVRIGWTCLARLRAVLTADVPKIDADTASAMAAVKELQADYGKPDYAKASAPSGDAALRGRIRKLREALAKYMDADPSNELGAEESDIYKQAREAYFGSHSAALARPAAAETKGPDDGDEKYLGDVSVWVKGNQVVVFGFPTGDHNCDAMGCSSIQHAIVRGRITALDAGFAALAEPSA